MNRSHLLYLHQPLLKHMIENVCIPVHKITNVLIVLLRNEVLHMATIRPFGLLPLHLRHGLVDLQPLLVPLPQVGEVQGLEQHAARRLVHLSLGGLLEGGHHVLEDAREDKVAEHVPRLV